ncbi:hypothetical protein GURASL_34230 [Geotalea uraniireducens]|uniref:Uncharacterized protein n=1 Tax=Geotalea uraniireducens TaxID=351604 RepID=A0ABN6VVV2_9BACT|nr:hypothetical protein [Geotalea uraniireducens]BDV44500.1 hypothetical protein GURASL_34230 [Geotalea uraniireducens]
MENYLLLVFVLNILLILGDASLGYHVVPALLGKHAAAVEDEEPDAAAATALAAQRTRPLLAGVVALYMFFTCLGYFRHSAVAMLVVTGVVVLDIAVQLVLRRGLAKQDHPDR